MRPLRKIGHEENKVGGHRSCVVQPALSAIGVDDGKPSHRGVEETIRGEIVKSPDVTPVNEPQK